MVLPYVYVTRRDLGRGIDTHSPKTALPEGYAEDLQNFDTNSNGKLETRRGYEGLYGWLPIRAVAAEHSGTQILLTLPGGVDVTTKSKSALVVSGRLSTATAGDTPAGDFTTTAATHWYPTWEVFSQLSLIAPTGTVTVDGAVHGRTTTQFWPVLFEGTPGVTATPIIIDSTSINSTSYDVDFTYTVAADADVYVQYTDVVTAAGTVYHRSVTQTAAAAVTFSGSTCTATAHGLAVDDVVVFATDGALPAELTAGTLYRVKTAPTADTFTVSTLDATATITTTTAGTGSHTWERRGWATTSGLHALNTQEILVKCWDTTINAGAVTEVMPAGYYVTTGGTVTVYFEADFTGTISMVAVPADQYDTQTAVAGANTYSDMSIGDANYVYVQALKYNATMSRWDAVVVDSYTADPATHTYDLTLTAPGAETYKLCWVAAELAGNVIAVTDTGAVSEDWTDGIPQLTVWGLGHADSYSTSAAREGHVTHLDVYRRAGESTVVAGLGGNLMAGTAAPTANDNYGTQSVGAKFVPSTSSDVVTGRYFYASAPSPTPNDYVVDATYINSSGGWLCNSVTYSAATHSWVLRLPKSGGFSTSGLSNLKWVDLSGFPYAQLNGTFRVSAVDSQASYLDLSIGVPAALTLTDTELARYDLTVPKGRVSCPYGRIPVSGLSAWDRPAAGDALSVSGLDTDAWEVVGVLGAGANVYYSGAGTPLTVPAGTAVGITRTAPTLMLEDIDGNLTAEGYVPGDMVSVTGLDNTPRVLWVFDALAADFVSITTWTTPDTVTWPTANLPSVGASVWLYAAGTIQVAGSTGNHTYDYDASGYYTVESVNLTTSAVTFVESFVPSGATLYNAGADWVMSVPYGQVCLDEAVEYTEAGSTRTQVSVTGRWVPIEAPAPTSGDLGQATWQDHLTAGGYLAQAPLHSTTLNDALFATQGDDPVVKYDGTNLYRAGTPRWPLGWAARVKTGSGSVAPGPEIDISAAVDATKTLTATFAPVQIGDRVYQATNLTTPALITDVREDSSGNTVMVVRASDNISSVNIGTNLTKVAQYRYYCKLVAVDVNGFVVQSATTGANDLVVDMVATGSIELRLTLPPAFGALDWDRLELEIYRTKANGATYYRIHRQLVDWDPAAPYLTFTDGLSDNDLLTVDAVSIALASSASGYDGFTAPGLLPYVEAPPRGAVVTSLDNRLVLGNLTGWPEAKLNFMPSAGSTTITKANLAGGRILVRRDGSESGTVTSINARFGYEFVSPASRTFTFVDADVNTGTDTITETAHGLTTGEAVRLTNSGGALPTGLAAATTYYVIKADANSFKLASSAANAHAGTPVDITAAAGGGTHTLTGYDGIGIDPTAITATTTTFVVASDAHGLAAGDWVYLYHSDTTSTTKSLRLAGWWRVASATTDTFTVSLTHDGTAGAASDVDRWVKASTTTDVPVLLGTDGNWTQRDGNPSSDSWQLQAPIRLAAAVNASMRAATTAAHSTAFTPWLVAYAGGDSELGQVVLRMPEASDETPEVVCPSSLSGYRLYVNEVQRAASAQVSFETGVWPSRLVRSFRNYPEVFDTPFAPDASTSDAVIDVNPADGQEITAVLPMFGESAGGAGSQLAQTLLVFKTASVYLVNIDTRTVERLNTRGQGCTAPRSVATTQEGVIFANKSGVYRINRDYTLSTVGLMLSGLWRDDVNSSALDEACATHYAEGRRYKLAVPYDGYDYANVVLVYDYDREGQGQEFGAWTRYTNHTPVWWANDGADAYWASQDGNVFRIRRTGTASDYRDDADAVAEQVAVLRAEDFDLPGVRKAVSHVTLTVETDRTALTNLVVKSAPNLSSTYTEGGRVSFVPADGRHQTLRVPPPSRRATHIQLRITHSTTREVCVLTGIMYTVAQLTTKLVQDSGDA